MQHALGVRARKSTISFVTPYSASMPTKTGIPVRRGRADVAATSGQSEPLHDLEAVVAVVVVCVTG